ncbi:hypothetical protein GQ457_15G021680 [Hibiscus cannabinus]
MSLMSWNVRGLGNKETTRALKNVAFKFNPSIIFLSETKMKFNNAFYVHPEGIAGARGLAPWWMNDTKVIILKSGRQLIDTEISVNGEEIWFGIFIYGPPYTKENESFWNVLYSPRIN